MTGLYVKDSCFGALAKCLPVRCDGAPTGVFILAPDVPSDTVYEQVIFQLVKYKRVVGTQQVSDLSSKQTLVSPFTWVTFTDDLWETEKWPRQVQLLCPHDLPNISKCYICRIYEQWNRGFRCGFYPLLPAVRHLHYVSFGFSNHFEFCNFRLFLAKSLAGDWLILTGAGTDR
jgi:hypothetical protein